AGLQAAAGGERGQGAFRVERGDVGVAHQQRVAAADLGGEGILVPEQAGPDVDQVGVLASDLDDVFAAAPAGFLPAVADHFDQDVHDLVLGQLVGLQAQVGDLP